MLFWFIGISEGEEVWVYNGKFGLYFKCGSDLCSLVIYEQFFMVMLFEVEVLFQQFKFWGWGVVVVLFVIYEYEGCMLILFKLGCFGLYFIDGEKNVILCKGEDLNIFDLQWVCDILEECGKELQKKFGKVGMKKVVVSKVFVKVVVSKIVFKKVVVKLVVKKVVLKKVVSKFVKILVVKVVLLIWV